MELQRNGITGFNLIVTHLHFWVVQNTGSLFSSLKLLDFSSFRVMTFSVKCGHIDVLWNCLYCIVYNDDVCKSISPGHFNLRK